MFTYTLYNYETTITAVLCFCLTATVLIKPKPKQEANEILCLVCIQPRFTHDKRCVGGQ